MSTDRATAAASSRIARGLRNELDKRDTDRLNVPINICIAVAFLGLGCVARMVLPWPATKFLCGIAVIAVFVCGALAYMRHESRKAPHVEETKADPTP
jgi:hypothetical protein